MSQASNNNLQQIKRCLISVSNKSEIVELAQFLDERDIEIISTGGTKKLLAQNNIRVKDISDFTQFPEIMDGRVKTLHPKVHGGLLGINDNEKHQQQAQDNDILSIDLLIVNLYPFVETVAKTDDKDEIIENIDIGGPAMVRSAAKNFAYKTLITSHEQYDKLKTQLTSNNNQTDINYRQELAISAFKMIADYDLAIANWFDQDQLNLNYSLKQNLRYGENSHQKAKLYSTNSSGIVGAKQLQGKELSYNNINDADGAYNLILEFDNPTCAIIKHANPCGVASSNNILQSYQDALSCDSKSAFGGIVALNDKIEADLAEEISKMFFEVIIAKDISSEAQEILSKKKNLRILIADFNKTQQQQIKTVSGGVLVQDLDQQNFTKNDLELASKAEADDDAINNLIFAMQVCKHVKSNAIVVVQNNKAIGIGAGQMSRVDACEIACKRAQDFCQNNDDQGQLFLASDAFFPFADNIEIAHKYNIKAIIAPKGSVRDQEVIDKANELGIALYFIATRHFKH